MKLIFANKQLFNFTGTLPYLLNAVGVPVKLYNVRLQYTEFRNYILNYLHLAHILFEIPVKLRSIVTSSAAGNASHTPVIPNTADNANANMSIATNPLIIEAVNAHLTASTALSADVPTILIPANRNPLLQGRRSARRLDPRPG